MFLKGAVIAKSIHYVVVGRINIVFQRCEISLMELKKKKKKALAFTNDKGLLLKKKTPHLFHR